MKARDTSSPDYQTVTPETGAVKRPGRLKKVAVYAATILGMGGGLGVGVASGAAQEVGHDIAATAHAMAFPTANGSESKPSVVKTVKTVKTHILNGTILLEPGTELSLVPGPASRDKASDAYINVAVTEPILAIRPLVNEQAGGVTSYQFNLTPNGQGLKEITDQGTKQGINPLYTGNGDMLDLPADAVDDGGTASEYIPPSSTGNPNDAIFPLTAYAFSNGQVNYGNSSEVRAFSGQGGDPSEGVEAVTVPSGVSAAEFVTGENKVLGTTYRVGSE